MNLCSTKDNTDDEAKAVERRSYARGYAAGKKRKAKELSSEALLRKNNAFWQRAFLAALSSSILANNWSRGKIPITELDDRVKLASEVADAALVYAEPHI